MRTVTLLLIFNLISFISYAQLTNGLVARYDFENGTVINQVDNKTGINNGATAATDRFGNSNQAFYFDGIDDRIKLDTTGLALNEFTYSVWVKIDSFPATTGNRSWIMRVGGDNNNYEQLINLNNSYNTGTPVIANGFGGAGYNVAAPVSSTYEDVDRSMDSSWNHLVFVRADTFWAFYVNDTLVDSVHHSPLTPYYGNNGIIAMVGARNDSSYLFNGFIDDIKIYNRAISETEVSLLYNEMPTALNQVSGHTKIDLFPNPSLGQLYLNFGKSMKDIQVNMYDLQGRTLQTSIFQDQRNITLELPKEPMLYVVEIIADGERSIHKVVKK